MAIQCPDCGREYDVTLFQFGRTLHCTCGARVGLEHRLVPVVTSSESRFMVDAMLGGLARWLRILGYDTAFDPHISDEELVRRSLTEGRHILTRDRKLPEEWRVEGCTMLKGEDSEGQLREVFERFGLEVGERLFSRCTLCNTLLDPLPREEAFERVPGRVFEEHETFSHCRECDQVFWEGSHTERMRVRLREMGLG
jgi:uncharacterized protein with PIN domain